MPNCARIGRDSHGPVSGMGGQMVSLRAPKIITSAYNPIVIIIVARVATVGEKWSSLTLLCKYGRPPRLSHACLLGILSGLG